MMPEASPWDEIAIPDADFNVRQVPVDAPVSCFWGRDSGGSCLFVLELHGDHMIQYRKNIISVHGIGVDLRRTGSNQQSLVLTLGSQVNRDLFGGLCRTLASSLEHATDSSSALSIALMHIRRWKIFLSGRGKRLSLEEMRGLFAELLFLLELLGRFPSSRGAVDAWIGPERSHQDFLFCNTAVEVKALSGGERSTVRISSEDQLESLSDALFLRIYKLSTLPESKSSRSLNDIVAVVQERLEEPEAVEEFDRKLVAYGYAPLPEYDEPIFAASNVATYRVHGEFPRLIRSHIPPSIGKVTYDIRLEAISSYECNGGDIFEGQ